MHVSIVLDILSRRFACRSILVKKVSMSRRIRKGRLSISFALLTSWLKMKDFMSCISGGSMLTTRVGEGCPRDG